MNNLSETLEINGRSMTLPLLVKGAKGCSFTLSQESIRNMQLSLGVIEKVLKEDKQTVYGVNTGFGYFANQKIPHERLLDLQKNILRSHATAHGTPLSIEEVRAMIILRVNALAKGFSGIRPEVCEFYLTLLEKQIYPVVPEQGSVGASGDLAPLAHLALPLIGEGEVFYRGHRMLSKDALAQEGLVPLQIQEKEGISLVNGTQAMLAVGGLSLHQAETLCSLADLITALSYEGLKASMAPLHSEIHRSRPHRGQIESANHIRAALSGSFLETFSDPARIQDSYSLRCAPQVHGASRDAIAYAISVFEVEMNSSTDNPLVFPESNEVVSGGNFHGQPLALASDFASMAVAELGNISDRRLELLMNPNMSGLPGFLAHDEGTCSGYMALQYLTASLVNENKILTHPACTDSIPGNVGIEDHVSMGMTSAKKLRTIVENVYMILSAELVAAAQAVDLHQLKPLGKETRDLFHTLRNVLPKLEEDRIISKDVEIAKSVLKDFLNTDEQ